MTLVNRSLFMYISVLCFIAGILLFPAFSVFAEEPSSEAQKQTIQQQLDVLQKEVDELDGQIEKTRGEKETLAREVSVLDTENKKRQLEIKRLSLVVAQANEDIKKKNREVQVLGLKVESIREQLKSALLTYYRQNSASIFEALLTYSSLSAYFDALNNLENIQAKIQDALVDIRRTREQAGKARDELQEFKEEQGALRSLQEQEKRVIDRNKNEKNELLQLTKGKEALFQSILAQKKKNLAALKSQLFYLERTGVSAEDALKFAKLAAERAGIRPEFLLALLEVETGRQYEDGVITAGTYIGTGHWKRDLYDCYVGLGKRSVAEKQKAALFEITDKLNLDPDKMPVSRKPYYGCGGAIGPAQFLPATWLLFESRVAKLTGNVPANPWNIEDSFTASAIFLADSGARLKTVDGETRAARTYISGKSTCPAGGSARSACLWYSKKILSLTKEIARNIN